MNKILFFIVSLISLQYLYAANWQKIKNSIEDNIVVIEYYEQTESVEAIVEKSRIKRFSTGILLNDKGLILTSADIFSANLESSSSSLFFRASRIPQDIKVKAAKKDYGSAVFIGKDDDKGIAFIRLTEPVKCNLKFIKRDKLIIGESIFLVNRLDSDYNSEFIISKRDVLSEISTPAECYLCDPLIKTLSDFGLAVNAKGEALGIYRSGASAGFHYGNRSGSSPLEITLYKTIKSLIDNPPIYKKKDTERKKWLGVYTQPFSRAMASYFGDEKLKGIFISTVIKNSPAEKAGLKMKDVVIEVDGEKIEAEEDSDLRKFRDIIRNKKSDKISFKVYRDGIEQTILVNLDETPISQFLAKEVSSEFFGFSVKELTQDVILSQRLDGDDNGLWVSRVERGGWADVAGLYVGDLLLEINRRKTKDINKIEEILRQIEKKNSEYVMLFINRRGQTQFLFMDIRKGIK